MPPLPDPQPIAPPPMSGEVLCGNPGPTPHLGPLLIDVACDRAFEDLVGCAADAQVSYGRRLGRPIGFDAGGVALLDEVVQTLRASGCAPSDPDYAGQVRGLGAFLACAMLGRGGSIIAVRRGDPYAAFSIYTVRTQCEFFPFRAIRRVLAGEPGSGLAPWYRGFLDRC
jgi:hypothetical protein